jgi:hypothetical protein
MHSDATDSLNLCLLLKCRQCRRHDEWNDRRTEGESARELAPCLGKQANLFDGTLLSAGVFTIQAAHHLGHKDITMLARHYGHLIAEVANLPGATFEEKFGAIWAIGPNSSGLDNSRLRVTTGLPASMTMASRPRPTREMTGRTD